MKRKIFISINFSDKLKRVLTARAEKWQNLPVKWTKEENLHVTLLHLGYLLDEQVCAVCDAVRTATEDQDGFDLEFDRIALAPNEEDPQYFWLFGKQSNELKILREDIEKELDIFLKEGKSFSPHITLGRIRKKMWQEQEPRNIPEEKINVVFGVESIDIMASHFGDGKNEYTLIESCPLG